MVSNMLYHVLKIIENNKFDWFQVSVEGKVVKQTSYDSIQKLPAMSLTEKLIILLPGQWIFMAEVNLPKSSRQEMAQALPFLIEDKVNVAVEKLHIITENKKRGRYLIVAIEKLKMEEIIDLIKEKGYKPFTVMPDFIALKRRENCWSLFLDRDMALLRTDEREGFSVPKRQLSLALSLKLKQVAPDATILIDVFNTESAPVLETMDERLSNLKFKVMNESCFFDVTIFDDRPPLNLLQGQYRCNTMRTNKKSAWHYVKITIIAWVTTCFISKLVLCGYYSHQATLLQNQLAVAYQRIFPGQSGGDIKAMMRHELILRQNQHKPDDFITQLSDVGKLLKNNTHITVIGLAYQDRQLTLSLTATTLAQFTHFTKEIEAMGLLVKQNQVEAGVKNIKGEFILMRPES